MWLPRQLRRSDKVEDGDVLTEEPVLCQKPSLLVITSDARLYYGLFSVAIDLGWKITWAKTSVHAAELFFAQPAALVVYDDHLHGGGWCEILPYLADFPGHPLVLLAASELDEELWTTVLRCRGYDAVRRDAGSEEWKRELRFAWRTVAFARTNQRFGWPRQESAA